MAGVSEGSVDRVLHNRGNVSKKSEAKVRAVLERIHYQPNKYASVLASNRNWTIGCLTPSPDESPYWRQVECGVTRAADELANQNVSVEKFRFNQFDEASFGEALERMAASGLDGLVFPPVFKETAEAFASRLESASVPYALLDSDLPGHGPVCYYGQHSPQSGYVAARLLHPWLRDGGVLVVHFGQEKRNIQNQVAERRKGFMRFAEEWLQGVPVREVDLAAGGEAVIEAVRASRPDACVVFNSRAHVVADLLRAAGVADGIRLVGYDTIPENVERLRGGGVWCLIGQRPETQGFHAVKALGDLLVFRTRPARVNYMPIDILTSDNIDYYSDLE